MNRLTHNYINTFLIITLSNESNSLKMPPVSLMLVPEAAGQRELEEGTEGSSFKMSKDKVKEQEL